MKSWQAWMALFLLWHLTLRGALDDGDPLWILVAAWAASGACLLVSIVEIFRDWNRRAGDPQ